MPHVLRLIQAACATQTRFPERAWATPLDGVAQALSEGRTCPAAAWNPNLAPATGSPGGPFDYPLPPTQLT